MTNVIGEDPFRITRGFARTSLGQLHYRAAGEGPPLLLLHNTALSSTMYLGVLPFFARRFAVYAIDMLGQGDSDPAPSAELELRDYARVIVEAADSLNLDKVFLAGHHCGAAIAVETALLAPQRIRRLVVSGLPYWRNPNTPRAQLDNPRFAQVPPDSDGSYLKALWERDTVTEFGPDYVAEAFLDHLKACPNVYGPLRALFRWDSSARLPLISVPTLVMCSESDIFRKNIGFAQASVPGSELRILPGGEQHPLYQQDAYAKAVAEFFSAPTEGKQSPFQP